MGQDAIQRARSSSRTVVSHPCFRDLLFSEVWQQTQFLQMQMQSMLCIEAQFHMCALLSVIAFSVHMLTDQVVS